MSSLGVVYLSTQFKQFSTCSFRIKLKTMSNPYSSPQNKSSRPSSSGGQNPLASLKGPAISLIVVSVISILNVLAGPFVNAAIGTYEIGSSQFNIAFAAAIGFALIQGFIGFSGKLMLDGKSHGICMAGAIVACIPICTPCIVLGIPFGIWAIVVLQQPEVKQAFR